MNKLLKDNFLKNETNNFTRFMLKNGMSINKISLLIKDYIKKYNHIKKNMSPEMWKRNLCYSKGIIK